MYSSVTPYTLYGIRCIRVQKSCLLYRINEAVYVHKYGAHIPGLDYDDEAGMLNAAGIFDSQHVVVFPDIRILGY